MIEWLAWGAGPALEWARLAVRALWQGSLIFIVIWCFVKLLPRISPSFRYGIWLLTYLRLLSGFMLIKPLDLPLLPDLKKVPMFYYDVTATTPNEQIIKTSQSLISGDFISSLFHSAGPIFIVFWLSGAALFTLGLIYQYFRQRSIYHNGVTVCEQVIVDCYKELGRRLKIRRMPRLLTADFQGSPFLKGLARPAIFLPESMKTRFQISDIKLVLAHELAHYKRGDLYWNWLPAVARAVFFFHPLVWMAEREWTEAQEMCCDHLALQIAKAPSGDYGDILLRMAVQPQLSLNNQAGVFYLSETKQSLKKRILALKPQSPKKPLLTWLGLTLIFMGLIVPFQLGFCKPFPVYLEMKYKPVYKPALSRVVKTLYVSYYIPFFEQDDIKTVNISVDGQNIPVKKWDNFAGECYYHRGTGYPFKGNREISVKVITKTGEILKKYSVSFHENLNWTNYKTF